MSKFANKRILVTGATGLIGSHIVRRLLMIDGIEVLALGRSIEKIKSTFEDVEYPEKLVAVQHDISQPLPTDIGKLDYIFNAAGTISGETVRNHPYDVIKSNLSGTTNCLDYLRQQGEGVMVVFSSATVYSDEARSFSEMETNVSESIDSLSAPYSQTKRMIEVIANAYRKQYGVDVLIARFSYVYGYSKNMLDNAFYGFVQKALAQENIEINNPNLPQRDNIYVEDAVEGLLHLLEKGIKSGTYNISSNGEKGNYAALDEIATYIALFVNKKRNSSETNVIYKSKRSVKTGGRFYPTQNSNQLDGMYKRVWKKELIRQCSNMLQR